MTERRFPPSPFQPEQIFCDRVRAKSSQLFLAIRDFLLDEDEDCAFSAREFIKRKSRAEESRKRKLARDASDLLFHARVKR